MLQDTFKLKKIRVAHIHLDKKFFKLGDAFFSSEFENQLFFFGPTNEPMLYAGSEIIIFEKNQNSIASLINFCADFDLVVFYSLDNFLASVVLQLPKNITIAWRFFGFELYLKDKEKYYSESTRKVLKE
jgi:hypothetical protein